ncbi:MAG TPA: hypothetical protein VFU07_07045 [Candidatus Lumbricidophila sp.]|nr:hypothetical protein [Candidatus Lumbricidophila sp.]
MTEVGDPNVMVQAVGETTVAYLGRTNLRALDVVLYPAEQRAVLWVRLRNSSLDSQLAAIASFADVLECYADELELDLRFGEPTAPTSVDATSRAMSLSH